MSAHADALSVDLTCAYQPIVELETGDIFGYEALARDETGTFPAAAFDAAREDGTLNTIDSECRVAAVQGALAAGLRPPAALFINHEPMALGVTPPAHLLRPLMKSTGALNVYAEITERAIADSPGRLITATRRLRALGLRIAIDDVGVDPRSLAMLPIIKPDVIKLDISLIQAKPDIESAAVMTAVRAHAKATGALVVAEGIETEQHLINARTLGATLGQGWLFGRPGALPKGRPIKTNGPHPSLRPPSIPEPEIPTDIVGRTTRMTPGKKDFLIAISKHLERQALRRGADTIIVSCFQHERFFTRETRERYAKLAQSVGLVVALGEGMPDEPAPGVQGGALDPADGLLGEWTVAVLGPHYGVALVARDLGDSGPEADRRFNFTMTFEPDEVAEIVTALLARVDPPRADTVPLAA